MFGYIFKNSEEYAKILIVIWLKLREIYLDANKNDGVSLDKRLESLARFCRTIRKKCVKLNKFPKFSNFLKSIEYECKDKKETINKLSHVSMILRMLDLPKPINDLMDTLGLGNMQDNEFANMVNELFEENNELKKVENEQLEEGTLIDYINRKYDKNYSEKVIEKNLEKKYIKIEKPVVDKPVIQNIKEVKNVNNIDEFNKKMLDNMNHDIHISRRYINSNYNSLPQRVITQKEIPQIEIPQREIPPREYPQRAILNYGNNRRMSTFDTFSNNQNILNNTILRRQW